MTEAFGQQMDMFFMEKEVQKQLADIQLRALAADIGLIKNVTSIQKTKK